MFGSPATPTLTGERGEETPSNDLQRAREERKKGRTLSSPGPGQGLGFGPPGWGGQGYPDTSPSLSSGPKKGGVTNPVLFFRLFVLTVYYHFDKSAAERTRKEC